MAAMIAHIPRNVDDVVETEHVHERLTRSGMTFFYTLKVLQQPERARACGSGSKSAADRRPVDPPPVVQLKIRKGLTKEDAKDVTMSYDGNFFLFAELANARPIAHGRVNTPNANQPPVLTGMPVSGMAYLDRPSEAGYFLFPDLSVRHEGRYVLAFHLYEEIKNPEDRDMTSDPAEDDSPCFNYRMAVKSLAFNVFSAKKFPGLTESTHLSKTISEQGCRVRIRRDVRMRRREGKPSGNDFENNNNTNNHNNADNDFRNGRRTQTPEIRSNADQQYRDRSASNSSEHRVVYPSAPERRPSAVESYAHQPPPPPPPPHYAGPAPSNNYLRFGADSSTAPYPPQPHVQPVAQPSPVSPTASYHSSSQPSPYSMAPSYYSNRPSPHYASSNPPPTPYDHYDRRSSMVPPSPSHGPREADISRTVDMRRDSMSNYRQTALAPMDSSSRQSLQLPPIQNLEHLRCAPPAPAHLNRNDFIEPGPVQQGVMPESTARAGSKRNYGDSFAESNRPLYDGQRPQEIHHNHPAHMWDPRSAAELNYKRADGHWAAKPSGTFQ
ncbi:Developmental and secondary metabolism regulator veA [Colletotrichum trifolii]|uniref:Developmental and secondary metabolism regulator veA n=1 Tax=Colletotrichum trifolii TaxID=5466 RepID=A0A4R8RVX7_COLTR|nr:Developmental and secondary metabolism regulator veA [Colletotrichum trifolii]